MSIHIEAGKNDIADVVLLPGDPLRAKFIAENYLSSSKCYNKIRGMYGFTGTYKGQWISVQGTGMGIPSASIYIDELINEYEVKRLIRIGTCGSMSKAIKIKDVILALSASTDSNINAEVFPNATYSPSADFELLHKAYTIAKDMELSVIAGNVLTTDLFYHNKPDYWKKWADYGVLCAEMETAGLYTLASKYGVKALSILTVSDSLISGEQISSDERETKVSEMIKLGLESALSPNN